jgi:hypothetical protein
VQQELVAAQDKARRAANQAAKSQASTALRSIVKFMKMYSMAIDVYL